MKIVQSIVDGAFRLAIARSRRGGRRFAFNRAFSTSKIDVSKSIKSNRRDRIRPITRNHTQSNAIQRNPIRSNPPLDRADLRRREIRPIDRPSPRLRPTAARVRSASSPARPPRATARPLNPHPRLARRRRRARRPRDNVPEWSKGVDLGRTRIDARNFPLLTRAGSNPVIVTTF